MSANNQKLTTVDRIELPTEAADEIAERITASERPTEQDVLDHAHDLVDRRTEFVTENGEELVDAVAERVD